MNVQTVSRPYILSFWSSGNSYPLTSEEAQRLIDSYPVVKASRQMVRLKGDGHGNDTVIRPATLGGGNAFEVTR